MNGMRVPEKKDFYVSETVKECLVAVAKMSRKAPQNILVKGMQGCGKTELGEQFAARLNRVCFPPFQIGLLSESGQLFGQQTLKDSNVQYQSFLFLDAIQIKNSVIILDEINRAEHPKALNALLSVLDDRRYIWIDELAKKITVAEGVIFFATMNEGTEFSGTEFLDAALSDRFSYVIEMGILPEKQETALLVQRVEMPEGEAVHLVGIFRSIRKAGIKVSTRRALSIAYLIQSGLGIRKALTFTLGADKSELEKVLLSIHLGTEEELEKEEEQWIQL